VGAAGENGTLVMLRDANSDYTIDNISEMAAIPGEIQVMADHQGADCNPDFCVLTLPRAGRDWHILMSRGRNLVPERALACGRRTRRYRRVGPVVAGDLPPALDQGRWPYAEPHGQPDHRSGRPER